MVSRLIGPTVAAVVKPRIRPLGRNDGSTVVSCGMLVATRDEPQENAPGLPRAFDRSGLRRFGARRQAEQSLAEGCRWPAVRRIRRASTAGLCRIALGAVKEDS